MHMSGFPKFTWVCARSRIQYERLSKVYIGVEVWFFDPILRNYYRTVSCYSRTWCGGEIGEEGGSMGREECIYIGEADGCG